MLADHTHQSAGTQRQGRMRTRKTSQTDKSAHQPALPEVQGFSDSGRISHRLVIACMLIEEGLLEFTDKQMQNFKSRSDVTSALASVVPSALVPDL